MAGLMDSYSLLLISRNNLGTMFKTSDYSVNSSHKAVTVNGFLIITGCNKAQLRLQTFAMSAPQKPAV